MLHDCIISKKGYYDNQIMSWMNRPRIFSKNIWEPTIMILKNQGINISLVWNILNPWTRPGISDWRARNLGRGWLIRFFSLIFHPFVFLSWKRGTISPIALPTGPCGYFINYPLHKRVVQWEPAVSSQKINLHVVSSMSKNEAAFCLLSNNTYWINFNCQMKRCACWSPPHGSIALWSDIVLQHK